MLVPTLFNEQLPFSGTNNIITFLGTKFTTIQNSARLLETHQQKYSYIHETAMDTKKTQKTSHQKNPPDRHYQQHAQMLPFSFDYKTLKGYISK